MHPFQEGVLSGVPILAREETTMSMPILFQDNPNPGVANIESKDIG